MIENLDGIHETVNFKENTNIRIHDNVIDENYPPHWHMPIEILMPVENCYDATCSGHDFHLRTYDILVICPGVIHNLTAPKQGRRIIFQAECAPLYQIKEIESLLTILSPATLITPEQYPLLHTRMRDLLISATEDYQTDLPMIDASIYSKLLEMFVLLGRNHTQSVKCYEFGYSKQNEFTEKFLFVCNYINEHCTEDLSLDDVAELAGFSKYHFSRLFKKFTNISFYKYLNQKRIATAERLLVDPKLTITDVALQSGFASMSTFIRMFRIVKNCTPKEFRNMYTR